MAGQAKAKGNEEVLDTHVLDRLVVGVGGAVGCVYDCVV